MSRREQRLPKWLWNPEARVAFTRRTWAIFGTFVILFVLAGVGRAFEIIESSTFTVFARLLTFGSLGLLVWAKRRQRSRW